jgi:hypothetical protein
VRTIFLAALLTLAPSTPAQPPSVRLAMSKNLREALERSGFEDGIRTTDVPDLDRKLTSSAFGTSSDTFVAAYYFQDQLEDQGLGPLHVSLFDRSRREWVHQPDVTADLEKLGLRSGGSVTRVVVTPKILLVDTHYSPSAGFTVVLDHSLSIVTSLLGYGAQVATDGSIWYFGDMVHFADTHQETLKMFDVGRRIELEVFPGEKRSPLAEGYRRHIQTIYASLPSVQRDPEFDRSIPSVLERDSKTFAFVVGYGSDYLEGSGVAHQRLTTIGRCDRQSSGEWSCSEDEIAKFARDAKVSISPDSDGRYGQRALETLVRSALDRKP